jgi:hypothetical protein
MTIDYDAFALALLKNSTLKTIKGCVETKSGLPILIFAAAFPE